MHLVRIIKVHGEIPLELVNVTGCTLLFRDKWPILFLSSSYSISLRVYTSLFIHDRRNRRDVSSFMQNPTTIDLSTKSRETRSLSLFLSFSRGSVTRDRIHGISTGYSLSDRNPMEITAVLFPSIQVSSFFPPFISFTFACSYSCSRLSPLLPS